MKTIDLTAKITGLTKSEPDEQGFVNFDHTEFRHAMDWWVGILYMAIKDQASSLHFHAWPTSGVANEGLRYVVDWTHYELIPPPFEMAGEMVEAARELLGTPIRSRFERLFGLNTSGRFRLASKTVVTEWAGVCWKCDSAMGVDLFRLSPGVSKKRQPLAEATAIS